MKMTKEDLSSWPFRRNTIQIRMDKRFVDFIKKEYPGVTNAERSRRILERLLYGKK